MNIGDTSQKIYIILFLKISKGITYILITCNIIYWLIEMHKATKELTGIKKAWGQILEHEHLWIILVKGFHK